MNPQILELIDENKKLKEELEKYEKATNIFLNHFLQDPVLRAHTTLFKQIMDALEGE